MGDGGSGTPSTKEAVKNLTTQESGESLGILQTTVFPPMGYYFLLLIDLNSGNMQIKDMALKFSGSYKQCKPCTGSTSYKKRSPYPDFDAASEGVPFPYMGGSTSSTPAWDFTSAGHYPGRSDMRFTGVFSGDGTLGYRESFSVQDLVLEDEDEPKEWMAQVEPGVHITFVSLPNGGNDLKRIRFSREMFDKWQAQQWWGENYDRIMELYNVQRFNRQALHTPPRSEDEYMDIMHGRCIVFQVEVSNRKNYTMQTQRDSSYSRMGSAMESPMPHWTPRNNYKPYSAGPSGFGPGGTRGEASFDAARTTTSSRDEPSVSVSNGSEMEAEWVEQDEPGVYITIRQLADGTRELRRVRFSRERFGEVNAKQWWEENRERIQAQYL
ncbi:hypothetical protein V6N12_043983 [Hibiscus sabdariffa]|uniref:BRX domain-containing protein n=1 Tax=Hibiscus sabdariffa TaxID=183260 RepID=A0ABR2DG21_9ROSI